MLRVGCAASTRIDDAHEHAFAGIVAYYNANRRYQRRSLIRLCDIRSRNLKHLGLEAQPFSVSAAANDLS